MRVAGIPSFSTKTDNIVQHSDFLVFKNQILFIAQTSDISKLLNYTSRKGTKWDFTLKTIPCPISLKTTSCQHLSSRIFFLCTYLVECRHWSCGGLGMSQIVKPPERTLVTYTNTHTKTDHANIVLLKCWNRTIAACFFFYVWYNLQNMCYNNKSDNRL